jgi:RNase P protein component
LREAIGLIPLRDDCDYVVIATKAVTEVPFGDLTGWLWRAVAEEA